MFLPKLYKPSRNLAVPEHAITLRLWSVTTFRARRAFFHAALKGLSRSTIESLRISPLLSDVNSSCRRGQALLGGSYSSSCVVLYE